MGVPTIWEAIKPGFDERVPFEWFVSDFYAKNGRSIRIAIDAFQWIFESKGGMMIGVPMKAQITKLMVNFHVRIRLLLSLNVSFVLVFDGRFKPSFKRNFGSVDSELLESKRFDDEYAEILNGLNGEDYYSDASSQDMKELLKELDRLNISYVHAVGEGEAEAARLQRTGIVDYVLSNDSDSIIYGATKILRNFSKNEEDKPSAVGNLNKTKEYWCTPIDMGKVCLRTGLDKYRILFYSILKGADYNVGVTSLGDERTLQYALCSTKFIKQHVSGFDYDSLPDFATRFKNIFVSRDRESCKNITESFPEYSKRIEKYEKFKKLLFTYLSNHSKELFGRVERSIISKGELSGFPPDYVVMLYFNPIFTPQLFSFKDGDNNYGDHIDKNLISNIKLVESYNFFYQYKPGIVNDVSIWLTRHLSDAFILKLIRSGFSDLEQLGKFEKTKVKNEGTGYQITLVSFKFKNYLIDKLELFNKDENTKDEDKRLVWIPVALIPKSNEIYVSYLNSVLELENKKKEKQLQKTTSKSRRSKKKQVPIQTTNLYSMGFLKKKDETAKPKQPLQTKLMDAQSTPILIEDSDSDKELDQSSPLKTGNASPFKVQSDLKSLIQDSPIKNKAVKHTEESSPTKSNKYTNINIEKEEDYEEDDSMIKRADAPSKTPRRKLNFVSVEDSSVLELSQTEDSSIIEISRFHDSFIERKRAQKSQDTANTSIVEKKNILDEIMDSIEYSEEEQEEGEEV